MSFAPGDLVVCVKGYSHPLASGEYVKGRIYTVRDAGPLPCGKPGIRTEEVRLFSTRGAWDDNGIISPCSGDEMIGASRFRPVRDTDISMFTEMLTKAPTEKEPAL